MKGGKHKRWLKKEFKLGGGWLNQVHNKKNSQKSIHKKEPKKKLGWKGGGGHVTWSSIQPMKQLKKYTRENLNKGGLD